MDGLKVLNVQIENFKGIEKREVNMQGKSAFILGKNNAGKSSFLQAIAAPMGAKYMPIEPVTQGEERGQIEIELGGEMHGEMVKYTLGVYFSTENKKGRIEVMDSNGAKMPGGRKIIEGIIGNIGFDIFEFIKMGRTSSGQVSKAGVKQQIEILKQLMPQEGVVELDQLTADIAYLRAEKRNAHAEIKVINEAIENSPFTQEEIKKYDKPIDVTDINKQLQESSEVLSKYNEKVMNRDNQADKIQRIEDEMAEIKKKYEELKKRKEATKEMLDASNNWLSTHEKPDITELTNKLSTANEHNQKHNEIQSLIKQQKSLEEKNSRLEEINERIKDAEAEKKQVFASYPLPVKNLQFDEENITFKDLPLNDEQINTATLIRIGAKISMAMNPNLKLVIIRDGSLLDEDSINMLLKMCEKFDYQVLIEKVAEDEEFVVEFTEE